MIKINKFSNRNSIGNAYFDCIEITKNESRFIIFNDVQFKNLSSKLSRQKPIP